MSIDGLLYSLTGPRSIFFPPIKKAHPEGCAEKVFPHSLRHEFTHSEKKRITPFTKVLFSEYSIFNSCRTIILSQANQKVKKNKKETVVPFLLKRPSNILLSLCLILFCIINRLRRSLRSFDVVRARPTFYRWALSRGKARVRLFRYPQTARLSVLSVLSCWQRESFRLLCSRPP